MSKITVNEEQAIQITIDHGFEGNEFKTKIWQQRGCLSTDRTLDALIDKLKTIYHDVQVRGKGKKRKYILSNKKKQQTERQFNYKGTVLSNEDKLIDDYIFSQLVKLKTHDDMTFSAWIDKLKLHEVLNDTNIELMAKKIRDVYAGFPTIYNSYDIVNKFIQTIETRNKNIVKNAFRRLEKQNKIKVIEQHKAYTGKYETITAEEYEKINSGLRAFLKKNNIDYFYYYKANTSAIKNDRQLETIRLVNDYLYSNFKVMYIFKTFKVKILDNTIKRDITYQDFATAYIDSLLTLTINRANRRKYKESVNIWQRYYLINTLILLKLLIDVDNENIEKLFKQELSKFKKEVRQMQLEKIEEERNLFVIG